MVGLWNFICWNGNFGIVNLVPVNVANFVILVGGGKVFGIGH